MWESWEKSKDWGALVLTRLPLHTSWRSPVQPVMKPFLSFTVLAVLLYFLAGPSPAQASSSVAEGFEQFQHKVKELADTVATKAKEAISKIQNSEFSTKTRNWFKHNFQKVKDKMDATFSK
uniref:Apolipoprotein C-I isoform X2 n=1 Tax=Phascolarctos cinereus TaxID=38626 RepID=A0A6P5LPF5_PHACI|nr:apolipoprotein C-I isoform X2 [Phascolarctos cinereus]